MCTCLPHWVSRFLVLVKVCLSPMLSQHFASSVRPTSVDRTYSALPSCWRAPVRPSHVRHSYALRAACPSHGAAAPRACLSAVVRRLSVCGRALPASRSRVPGDTFRLLAPHACCVLSVPRPARDCTALMGFCALQCLQSTGGMLTTAPRGCPMTLQSFAPHRPGGCPMT